MFISGFLKLTAHDSLNQRENWANEMYHRWYCFTCPSEHEADMAQVPFFKSFAWPKWEPNHLPC